MTYSEILDQVKQMADQNESDILKKTCQLLYDELPHYNWVGFYFMNDDEQMLEIGPYVGAETDHTRIPYGKGICGQVAESGNTFLVDDVERESNYLACSIETRSEIVVPIHRNGKLIGQIDIDSHVVRAFGPEDEGMLKDIGVLLAPFCP